MPRGIYDHSKNKGLFKKGHKINKGKKNGLGHIYKPTIATLIKLSESHKWQVGELGGNWRGDKIGKTGVHQWVRRVRGTPNRCEICGTTELKLYDWANKNHTYKRIAEDYIRLCRSCHRKYDMKNNNYKNG